MNVRINGAGRGNATLPRNHVGARSDYDIDTRLDIGIARLADCENATVFDTDIGLDYTLVIEDDGIRDHGVNGLDGRALALPHSIANHFAPAKLDFLSWHRVLTLDFYNQPRVTQANPIAA
jgi:hypothetical protein